MDDILFKYVVERYIKHKTCCCRHRDQNETGTIYRYQFKNIVGRIETASVLLFLPSLIASKSTAFPRHFYKKVYLAAKNDYDCLYSLYLSARSCLVAIAGERISRYR